MMATSQISREAYLASGRVRWSRFLPGLCVAVAVAVLMACALHLAYILGFYLLFIAPLLALLVSASVWAAVLHWSQCRNRTVAVVFSFMLGVLVYLGAYEVGLLSIDGLQNAGRLERLPRYIWFRMSTDVARDVARPQNGPGAAPMPDAVQQGFNWLFFGGEFLAVLVGFVAVGRHWSRKAYCEPCGRWTKSETIRLPVGYGAAFWDALERGRATSPGAQELLTTQVAANVPGCVMMIEHCPDCSAEAAAQRVYLTVKDVPFRGMFGQDVAKYGVPAVASSPGRSRTIANRVALREEEIGALGAGFPGLKSSIESQPHRFADAHAVAQEIEESRKAQAGEWTGALAHIEAVEPGDAGLVLTRRNAVLQTLIALSSFVGCFALAFGPGVVALALGPRVPEAILGVAVCWMVVGLILSLFWFLWFPLYPTTQFMLRKTRRALGSRPSPAIDWNDPDLFFVDIVPRANWGKFMMENASDIGFLEVNAERRELVFEGDRERYWIPADSILGITHEAWAEGAQHQLQSAPSLNHVIVVRAMTANGPWETWFYRRHLKFQRRTAKRRLTDAQELERKIREMMERKPGASVQ